jgi:hypothetical protein
MLVLHDNEECRINLDLTNSFSTYLADYLEYHHEVPMVSEGLPKPNDILRTPPIHVLQDLRFCFCTSYVVLR